MSKLTKVDIRRLQTMEEAETCAKMMSSSEPWITLRRDNESSLKILTDPLKETYLATSDGKILGLIVLVKKGALIGYIQSICVAIDMRGMGIGGELMNYAEEMILRDSPNVFLMVSSFNNDAKRMYQRRGYEVVGEIRDYIVSGHSEIIMRKTIGSIADFQERQITHH